MAQIPAALGLLALLFGPSAIEGGINAVRENELLGTVDEEREDPVTGKKKTIKRGRWEPAERRLQREAQDSELRKAKFVLDSEKASLKDTQREKRMQDALGMLMNAKATSAAQASEAITRYGEVNNAAVGADLDAIVAPLMWSLQRFGTNI